ncbi:MAG: murein biosynthesis integral membrane protein MurJ [Roseiflexaceae bacterium]|nr:murein biosynthesis integral membrane protein MurJ [Roseiflexaceae bacterium]
MAPSNPSPLAAPGRRAAVISTLVVAVGYTLSRVLGIVRDIIITAQFGTSWQADAYQAAFQIPDFLYLVIMGGALGSAFIPVFNGLLGEEQPDAAWRLANGVLNTALIVMVLLAALVAWQADFLVGLIWRSFAPEKHALTVDLLRLMLIQPVLLGMGGLAKATLESFDRFSLPALGSNLYNIGIILGALLLAPWLGVHGLVLGVIGGAALFLAVQIPTLVRLGYRYRANFNLRTPGLSRVGWLMAPRVFGQSAWQLGLLVSSGIAASVAGDGAVRANAIALQLMLLPHGLLALSLGTVIFPRLARAHGSGDQASFRQITIDAVRSVVFLALPASVILGVLAVPVVRLLFERLNFTADSTALTAAALQTYAIGLTAFAAAEIIVRAFYAMQDTLTPVIAGMLTVALNIMLANLFVGQGLGLGGIGLAFSIAATCETLALVLILWRRWGTLAGLGRAFWSMLLVTACFAAALLGLRAASTGIVPAITAEGSYTWPVDFVALAAWTGAALLGCGGLYFGLASLIRLPEAAAITGRLKRLMRR